MLKGNTQVFVFSLFMIALSQVGMSLYIPSFPLIHTIFETSTRMVAWTLNIYIAGYALFILIWGTLADKLGRKASIKLALLLFFISSLLLAVTNNIFLFIFLRFFQGAAAGGLAVISRILIRDNFTDKALARGMSYLSIAFILALGLSQMLGGLIAGTSLWRICFAVNAIYALLLYFFVHSVEPTSIKKQVILKSIITNYFKLFKEKLFLYGAIIGGAGYSITVVFNMLSSFYYQNHLNFSPHAYGLIGLLIACSYLIGSFLLSWILIRLEVHQVAKLGFWGLIILGIFLLLHSILDLNYSLVLLLLCLVTIFQAFIYPCVMTMTLQAYPELSAPAIALFGCIQQVQAAVIGFVVSLDHPYNSLEPLFILIFLIGSIGLISLFTIFKTGSTSKASN